MAAAALTVSRMRPALTWRALDGDLVAGEVRARLRPDNRWFLYFDTWRADAYPPLADAVARDLGGDLYVTLEDAEYDALDACAQAGFAVHRRESYYRIPADRAAAGLAGAVLPAGLDVLSAADADITRLRRLDDALRQDVPGSEGWRWDAEEFRTETFGPFFDPATYLVAVDRASGEYAGLVRIWRNRAGPRLGLIATLARYRRRGVARALLGQAFGVLAARGETSVTCEVDDTNVASVSWLTGLGARRYGGNAELIRRQLPDWPEISGCGVNLFRAGGATVRAWTAARTTRCCLPRWPGATWAPSARCTSAMPGGSRSGFPGGATTGTWWRTRFRTPSSRCGRNRGASAATATSRRGCGGSRSAGW
jgi:ribosomal protein S18 acetylase RimI-like enzyme